MHLPELSMLKLIETNASKDGNQVRTLACRVAIQIAVTFYVCQTLVLLVKKET